MEEERKGFVFYRSYLNAVRLLPEEAQLEFLYALFAYALDGRTPELKSTNEKIAFELMRPNVNRSNTCYDRDTKNGKRGGAPKGNRNACKKEEQRDRRSRDPLKTTQKNKMKNNLKNNSSSCSYDTGLLHSQSADPPQWRPQPDGKGGEERVGPRFAMGGKVYEYYYAANSGEKRVRAVD